jgi:hypothetical protein
VSLRTTLAMVLAVVVRPRLWVTAVRQWYRLVPGGWWRCRPFLPVPAADYLRFRLVTQYGSENHAPSVTDVLNYLTWCHAQRAAA